LLLILLFFSQFYSQDFFYQLVGLLLDQPSHLDHIGTTLKQFNLKLELSKEAN
jgi:hypothetical protein